MRCDTCAWQKKGGCGTFQAIPRCDRHPDKNGGLLQPVRKVTKKKRHIRTKKDGCKKRKVTGPTWGPETCEYCGRSYRDNRALRNHWYSCSRSPKYRGPGGEGNRRRMSNLGVSVNGNSSRCDSCRRAHTGRCGTIEAHHRCERKPADWVGAERGDRRRQRVFVNKKLYDNGQSKVPFFEQFLATLSTTERGLAKTFWGYEVAQCDANYSTPHDPWELLSAPLNEIQEVLGREEGLRIHKSAMAFAAGGMEEARLLATVQRDPLNRTLKSLMKDGFPKPLSRWIRRLYHSLRVAGSGDEIIWKCCGKQHTKAGVVGGGDPIFYKRLEEFDCGHFNAPELIRQMDIGDHDRCVVCQETYNLFEETHCPFTHLTFKDIPSPPPENSTEVGSRLNDVPPVLGCLKALLFDIEAASPNERVKPEYNALRKQQDKEASTSKMQLDEGSKKQEHMMNSELEAAAMSDRVMHSTKMTFGKQRMQWIQKVKFATNVYQLAEALLTLETWIKSNWYRKSFDRSQWRLKALKLSKSESKVAVDATECGSARVLLTLLQQFDKGVLYTLQAQRKEQANSPHNSRQRRIDVIDSEAKGGDQEDTAEMGDCKDEKVKDNEMTEDDNTKAKNESTLSQNRFRDGQCARNSNCRFGPGHVGFCGGWKKTARKSPNKDIKAADSAKGKPGQCTRKQNCKYGFRHPGFCGGWAENDTRELRKVGGDVGAKTGTHNIRSPKEKENQDRRNSGSSSNKHDDNKCQTPNCPRPKNHSGLCGQIMRVWYSGTTSAALPHIFSCTAECKVCSNGEMPERTTVDEHEIYSYMKQPKECACLPVLNLPEEWTLGGPRKPVWAGYGSANGGWKELPDSGSVSQQQVGGVAANSGSANVSASADFDEAEGDSEWNEPVPKEPRR
eukprot:CAMPEP_0184485706 /NCGR_PEP_ID=MMETSP0113_2-20130426/7285_1 /TAXON_ID=91329 /ORGANISM="Norrisiella sphaerica, Strain BC52" /LENGTH=897 /DNA_ID=CAMNT_0026867281 /DNA_START=102 /DNA_END=2795 /DNA_ORIENTATION=-